VEVTDVGGVPVTGGVLGQDAGDMTITGCHNQGNVTVTKSTGTFWVGGISGVSPTSSSIKSCVNEATVKASQSAQHSYCGGIVGQGQGTIENCTNALEGVVIVEHTAPNAKYALAGGIVGKSNNTVTISGCVNNGTVKALVNTTNNLTGAGGIIGQPQQKVTLKDNTNNGSVYGENKHASSGRVYAGGLFATDVENASNLGAVSIIGNRNYGTIGAMATKSSNNTVKTAMPGVSAGGLFGLVGKTPNTAISADNANYGAITAEDAGVVASGGALAGASAVAAWSGTVGKNVTVNGTAWSETVTASWLCPVATNPVTANYVDAPAN